MTDLKKNVFGTLVKACVPFMSKSMARYSIAGIHICNSDKSIVYTASDGFGLVQIVQTPKGDPELDRNFSKEVFGNCRDLVPKECIQKFLKGKSLKQLNCMSELEFELQSSTFPNPGMVFAQTENHLKNMPEEHHFFKMGEHTITMLSDSLKALSKGLEKDATLPTEGMWLNANKMLFIRTKKLEISNFDVRAFYYLMGLRM